MPKGRVYNNYGKWVGRDLREIVVKGNCTIQVYYPPQGAADVPAGECHAVAAMAGQRGEAAHKCGMRRYVVSQERADDALHRLREVLVGRNGVVVPRMLRVAVEIGMLHKVPSYEVAHREFGDIGAKAGYYRALNGHLTDREADTYRRLLEASL